ncbi:lytic transglycosylase [Urechidicola croceus]|uniref:LysM domain-containing protein n=1 Tax=Urechidicola croceus TaxID=1850246 RepID=A0A1D8PAV0_9FLAO|nr:LysM peptidoglycan-binding domain-containing protein [Urechidicola croceus]AOW21704.1 hypothetical protein LPB138_13885 [Urechidicola croceus]
MKKIKLFLLLTLLTVLASCAQQKKYVSYTVKKGETIKSIAKDNDVKTKDLLRLNPDVSRKPEENTVIIIPNKSYKKSVKPEKVETVDENTHIVQPKETLFSISKKYGVTVDELKEENSITGNNLSVGRVIKIPVKSNEVVEETPVDTDSEVVGEVITYNTHTVVKDDTIYNLTKRFGLSADELLALNPDLKDGLKLGMILNIGDSSEGIINVFNDEITYKPLNIAMMLPYKVSSTSDYESQFKKNNSLLNIVTDFHLGALVAIDSLKAQGMNINLEVFDTENSNDKISRILSNSNFDTTDVVIGPLFLKNANTVSKSIHRSNKDISVIAPMYSKNQKSISGGGLVKASPNKELLEEKLYDYMLKKYSGENIVVVGDDKQSYKMSQIISKLRTHDSINSVTVIKPQNGYIKKDRFVEVIDSVQRNNWVILVGQDNVVTSDVVNNLGVMPKKNRNIQLFSFAKGRNFDNVSNNHLARLKFTYPQESFVDVLSTGYKSFEKQYKSKSKIGPSEYSIKGFDVTYDALMRLAKHDTFKDGAKAGVSERVGTKFEYSKKLFGSSLENVGVFIIQYQEDLKLKSID